MKIFVRLNNILRNNNICSRESNKKAKLKFVTSRSTHIRVGIQDTLIRTVQVMTVYLGQYGVVNCTACALDYLFTIFFSSPCTINIK